MMKTPIRWILRIWKEINLRHKVWRSLNTDEVAEPNSFAVEAAFTEGEAWLDALREHTGLYLSEGRQYGENGSSFIRMNIAWPQGRLEDGLKRLAEGVRDYEIIYF